MGHTRLSILDCTGRASQPRWSDAGDILLSYNGEIYNFTEVGGPEGRSDTLALLSFLARSGPDADLSKLDGMYALAAYFAKEETLLLARDPVGIKPLYLTLDDSGAKLAFASEIKGLLGVEWFRPEPNLDESVHAHVLQYGYVFTRAVRLMYRGVESTVPLVPTLLKNVYQLPPRHQLMVHLDGAIRFRETRLARNDEEPIEAFRHSVRAQSVSDVEVGVQLSGGIDSSLVAYEYARENPGVHGFYVSVDHPELNEDRWAEMAAHRIDSEFGLVFHRIRASREEVDRVLRDVVWMMDEPAIRHPNAVGLYLLCEFVRRETDVKVLLTGEGADEMFGGYSWHDGATTEDYDKRVRMFDFGGSEDSRTTFGGVRSTTVLARQLEYDRRVYLPPILLRQDRMSMAHSIESRVPFLGNDLLKLWPPLRPGKVALKEYAGKVFGSDFVERQKRGFGFPWSWFAYGRPRGRRIRWLRGPSKGGNKMEEWTLRAIRLWSEEFLEGGWMDRRRNAVTIGSGGRAK